MEKSDTNRSYTCGSSSFEEAGKEVKQPTTYQLYIKSLPIDVDCNIFRSPSITSRNSLMSMGV